jgi:tRNA-splicing ligase RtcB (3'-phosphate/5'-hydroxy nucleic acid ligase)
MIEFTGKYGSAKVMIDHIDEETSSQITSFVNHPAFTNKIAIMPDTHAGKGAVIGFTMPLGDKIVPSTVGVDGNCGMLTHIFDVKELTISRGSLDKLIREAVPFGKEVRAKAYRASEKKDTLWRGSSNRNLRFCMEFYRRFGVTITPTRYDYEWFEQKCKDIRMDVKRALCSLGTLGGGNHFIEIGKLESTGNIGVTVHSGSRQLGKCICDYWSAAPARKMREDAKALFDVGLAKIKQDYKNDHRRIPGAIKKLRAELGLDNKMAKSLSYLEGRDMYGYLSDMIFVEAYARENRRIIMEEIMRLMNLERHLTEAISTIHNYINFEDFIIRKGAISARKGEKVIIPMNMEDGTLICRGKGNPDWNYSAPHGAGRLFSRKKAKKEFDSAKVAERMHNKGIFTSAVPTDEVKEAYKDPKTIMDAIGPTVEIIDRIKPIMNLKEGE